MRNLTFVSLFIVAVLVASCASIKSRCGERENILLARHDLLPVIQATDSLQKFDIEINFMGKSLNGMLLVKKQTADNVRVVMNSYFGMSMMDFELSPTTSKVHYVLEAMNKPLIVNMFISDFQLLLGQNLSEQFQAERSSCKAGETLFSIKNSKGNYLYRTNPDGRVQSIKAPGVSVTDIPGNEARIITLKHSGIFTPTIRIQQSLSE